MDPTTTLTLIFLGVLTLLGLTYKPIRKAIGLLFIILGAIATFTFIGAIVGIPMILIGGVLLFM